MTMRSLAALLAVWMLAACGSEPDGVATRAAETDRGFELWRQYCAYCHGDDGRSVLPEVPNLSFTVIARPDEELVDLIRAGKGTMPGFRAAMRRDEILDVIQHMRSLPW